jgi:hypothetical protein
MILLMILRIRLLQQQPFLVSATVLCLHSVLQPAKLSLPSVLHLLSDAMDWRASAARLVILYNLEDKVMTDDEDELPAEEALDLIYNKMEEFERVQIIGQQIIGRGPDSADDLALHPTTIHNEHGELKFYLTKAKPLLRADIEKNLLERLAATEFQGSSIINPNQENSGSICGKKLGTRNL